MFLLQVFVFYTLAYRVFAIPSANFIERGIWDQNYQQKLGWFTRFVDAYMYPNNTAEAATINSTLFSEDVQGRVDLTNTFEGRELNTEYVFGLFSTIATQTNPKIFNILGVPISYTITEVTVTGNQLAGSFTFMQRFAGNTTLPVEVLIIFQFNDDGEITQYDATYRRAEWLFDTLITEISPLLALEANLTSPPTPAQVNEILINLSGESVCTVHQQYCIGENQQYPTFDACLEFMLSLPFGESYQLGQNTSNCRNLHQNMVPLRPNVHCPHIGPTGGGMCIPRSYVDVVTQQYFLSSFADPLALQ